MTFSIPKPKPCGQRHNIMILDNHLDMGGQEKKLFDLITRLDSSHFRVVICCLKDGGFFKTHFTEIGIPFYDNLLKHKFDALAYRKLVRIIKEEKIDLLYTYPNPNTLFFGNWARGAGHVKKLLVSFHSSRGDDGGRLLNGYMIRLLRRADSLAAVANLQKRTLIETEGLPDERWTVIHNGVDTDKYHPGRPNPQVIEELGVESDEVVITTIASIKPQKCIDVLLKSAAKVCAQVDRVRFIIVGKGPDRPRMEQLADELSISGRVTFAGLREDVDDILRLSDMFVLPSRPGPETCPNVVLEAMATGLPVVSTDVGSIWELVFDGESGYIVPPFDTEAIAAAILDLVNNPERMRAFGAKARSIAENKFSIQGMVDKREGLFSRLLCNPLSE